jgi:hypothetical protein
MTRTLMTPEWFQGFTSALLTFPLQSGSPTTLHTKYGRTHCAQARQNLHRTAQAHSSGAQPRCTAWARSPGGFANQWNQCAMLRTDEAASARQCTGATQLLLLSIQLLRSTRRGTMQRTLDKEPYIYTITAPYIHTEMVDKPRSNLMMFDTRTGTLERWK